MLMARFCVNIVLFGCYTHYSHIAASQYAKQLNTDSESYGSLVATAHSTLYLL